MVSVYPIPPPDKAFTQFYGFHSGVDPMKIPNRSDNNSNSTAAFDVDDANKKVRKPYTITKSRESWSEQEHDKFLEALHLFDRDWKKIEAFVGSKTVIQIRSHAQKYFLKVQKSGTSEHVPPPRPKRKAAHPYPQKAPKKVVSQPFQSPASLMETGHAVKHESVLIPRNAVLSTPLPSWSHNVLPLAHISKGDVRLAGVNNNYSSSSNESTPGVWTAKEVHPEVKQCDPTRVMPDFAQVYSFLGSVFDPSGSDQLQRLRNMDPIDVETVLLLMKNLTVNLVSHEFEDHMRLLSSYDSGIEDDTMGAQIPSASSCVKQVSAC